VVNVDSPSRMTLIGPRHDDYAADRMREIQAQILEAQKARARTPERIRITELVPLGMMLLAPFELDDSAPGPERRVHDGGPVELLIHPDDWDAMLKPVEAYIQANAADQPVPAELPPPLAPGDTGWHLYGIPVRDDTIKTRMEKDRARD
jgi:hypothetical protein